ncbi:SHOCT domain-containing protein [Mycolicibacter sinensis]|uniref:SHOCT domain-containing protein n=1 Tax=Mycolicibacter sinensis (strain JDM601) TaxID=875328 RepID=UPI0007EBB4F2|nr:SHOCT domain-containing protein [Mycolicibacter sinensis]OBH21797.1 hypothetical protein A5694_00575 [Mycolicibacter sinensis]
MLLDLLVAVVEVDSIAPFEGGGAGLEFGGLAIEAASLGPFAGLGITGEFGAASGLGLIGQTTPVGGLPGLAPPPGGLGPAAGLPAAGLSGAGRVGATWAGMGKAVPLGSLSVPQAWAAAAPSALREVALVSAQSSTAAAAAGAEAPYAEMALATMAGRAMAATVAPGRRAPAATQPDPTAAPRPAPEATEPAERRDDVTGVEVLAELRGLAELRDSGVLTDEEFNRQRERVIEDFIDD